MISLDTDILVYAHREDSHRDFTRFPDLKVRNPLIAR